MDADFYVMRGDDRQEKEEYKGAIEDYTQAVGLKQNYAEAYYKRANAYVNTGDFDNAIRDFSRVIDLKPDSRDILLGAYYGRGKIYLSITRDYESAVEDITGAIDGYNRLEDSRYDLARIAGTTASFVSGHSGVFLYLQRSDAYRSMGDFENAFKDLKSASQIVDDSDENFGKGVIYYENDDYDSALDAFRRSGCECCAAAVKLAKSRAVSGHIKSGDEYRNKGDYKSAADKYKKALEFSDPDNDQGKAFALALSVTGDVHYGNGDYKKAFEQYKNALEFDPVNQALKTLKQKYLESGNAYFQKGDYENAAKDYGKAFKYGPDNADAKNNLIASHNSLGGACFAKQDYDGAAAEYKKTLELDPDNADAKNNLIASHNSLGGACFAKQDYDGAAAEYKKALELDPDNADAKNGVEKAGEEKEKTEAAERRKEKISKVKSFIGGGALMALGWLVLYYFQGGGHPILTVLGAGALGFFGVCLCIGAGGEISVIAGLVAGIVGGIAFVNLNLDIGGFIRFLLGFLVGLNTGVFIGGIIGVTRKAMLPHAMPR